MEIPFSEGDSFETVWNILVKVIEECQVPWLLALSIGRWDEEARYAFNWLPRGRNGSVLVIDHYLIPTRSLHSYTTFIEPEYDSSDDEDALCCCGKCLGGGNQARITECESDDPNEPVKSGDDQSRTQDVSDDKPEPIISEIESSDEEASSDDEFFDAQE